MLFYCVFSFKDVILFFDYMYRDVEFVYMSTNGPGDQKKSVELELSVIVSCLVSVLGTKLRSST